MRSSDWIFGCFLLSGFLLVWLKYLYPNAYRLTLQFILFRHDEEEVEYFESSGGIHTLLLNLNFLVVFSIFIYFIKLWADGLSFFELHYIDHLKLLLGFGVYFTLQALAHVLLAKLMDTEKGTAKFLTQYQMWRFSLGFALLPICLLLVFSIYLNTLIMIISIVIAMYLFISSLYFSLKNLSFQRGRSLLYIIFYICTLEIAPVVWLVKWLI